VLPLANATERQLSHEGLRGVLHERGIALTNQQFLGVDRGSLQKDDCHQQRDEGEDGYSPWRFVPYGVSIQ
jgi:hypothetical protein